MDYSQLDSAAALCGCKIAENEAMCGHTSFKIGGPADRFAVIETAAQLKTMQQAAKTAHIPVFILGNGSNLLVSDRGIRGLVLTLGGDFKKIELLEDNETILCGGAVLLSSLCKFARENSLTGLEFAWGIPGSVGGAVYMNAGAYGGEMKDVVREAAHITPEGETGKFSREELGFAYRRSSYTDTGNVITMVRLKLEKGDRNQISEKMNELIGKRKEKQPYDLPSAGSTFKRPAGAFAAALIEECGLKGFACGDARVSEKHAGFVINSGGANCRDVLTVIEAVKEKVYKDKQIQLECEVKMIGEGFETPFAAD